MACLSTRPSTSGNLTHVDDDFSDGAQRCYRRWDPAAAADFDPAGLLPDPLKNSAPVPDSYLVMESYPVHDPRATWRSGWGRRFVLLLGWSAALTAVGGLFAAGHVGALWAWAISPAAAGFAAFTIVVMPEPRPAATPKPAPKYLVADQRINLLTAVPAPATDPTAHPVPRTISSLRAPRRLAVPQRQAA